MYTVIVIIRSLEYLSKQDSILVNLEILCSSDKCISVKRSRDIFTRVHYVCAGKLGQYPAVTLTGVVVVVQVHTHDESTKIKRKLSEGKRAAMIPHSRRVDNHCESGTLIMITF